MFVCTNRLECEAEQVKSVYKAAAMFKMHSAAEACSRFLADNLKIQNCLGMLLCQHVVDIQFNLAFFLSQTEQHVTIE